jgi:hypothetical protein
MFPTGGNVGTRSWSRTTTDFSSGRGYSHNYSSGGGATSYSMSHTTSYTYEEPLSRQLLGCWLVFCVPFCSWRWVSLTRMNGQRCAHMGSLRGMVLAEL